MRVVAQAPTAAAIPLTSTAAATTAFNIIQGGPTNVLGYGIGSGVGIIPTFNGAATAAAQCNLNVPGANRHPSFIARACGYFYLPGGTYTSSSAGSTWQVWLCGANTANFVAATGNALVKASMSFTYTSFAASTRPFQIVPWEVEAECFLSGPSAIFGTYGDTYPVGYANLNSKVNYSLVDPNGNQSGAAAATNGINFIAVNPTAEPAFQFAVAIVNSANGNFPSGTAAVMSQLVLEA
jgi:hypothetical protein